MCIFYFEIFSAFALTLKDLCSVIILHVYGYENPNLAVKWRSCPLGIKFDKTKSVFMYCPNLNLKKSLLEDEKYTEATLYGKNLPYTYFQ